MRIAVTGANGYVGTALCQYLLQRGIEVTALLRAKDGHAQDSHALSTPTAAGRSLTHKTVDYRDLNSLTEALAGADAVIHLIAKTHTKDALSELVEYRAVNVDLSCTVATAAQRAGVKRLVFLSSIKVNGESTTEQPFRNTDLPAPTTAYGISKLEAEQALAHTCGSALELVRLRPPLIYSANAKGNIHTLKQAIQKKLPLPLGRIHNKRSLIDLDLLCEYLYKSCIIAEANGKTLLISNHAPISTTELVRRIGRDIHTKPWLLPIPAAGIKLLGRLLGKQEAIEKLCGNLVVDTTEAQQLLQPSISSAH